MQKSYAFRHQRRVYRSYTDRAFSALALVVLLLNMPACFCGQPVIPNGAGGAAETETIQAQGINQNAPLLLQFKLSSKPRISRQLSGDHGGVLPTIGKNSYYYRGNIITGEEKFKLVSNMEPVTLFALDKEYFLLTQYYFNRELFQWYKLNAEKEFELLPLAVLPDALYTANLDEPRRTAFYRAWIVCVTAKDDAKTSAQWFHKLVSIAPRFPMEARSPEEHWGKAGSGDTRLIY